MASQPLIDLSSIDLNRVVADREAIYQALPHRGTFQQLDAIVHWDAERRIGVARRDVRLDEFWVPVHIPGRPLMPGVLMIEAAAQLTCYCSMQLNPLDKFMGFGGVDAVKFRGTITPPSTMYFLVYLSEVRSRRAIGQTQAFANGQLVFEGVVTGMIV